MENLFQFTMLFEKSKEMSEITTWYHKAFLPAPPLFRAWGSGTSGEAGSWRTDAIRNITGNAMFIRTHAVKTYSSGALKMATQYAGLPAVTGETDIVTALTFDASLVVPTSSVTTPPHVWQPVAIYLGLPA